MISIFKPGGFASARVDYDRSRHKPAALVRLCLRWAHLHSPLTLFISVLLVAGTSLVGHAQSNVGASPSTLFSNAQDHLKKMADLTPAQIADEADAIKARLDQRKTLAVSTVNDKSARTLLKLQFQRDFAATKDDEARTQLLAEYLAMARVLAAERELVRQQGKAATGGK